MTKHSYSKDVQALRDALASKHGEVKAEWNALIALADEQFMLLDQINKKIAEMGIIDKNGKKNPLIASKKDVIASLLKIYQQTGTTPWSESKIKVDTTESDKEALKSIMGE